jgi:hypothetical protein
LNRQLSGNKFIDADGATRPCNSIHMSWTKVTDSSRLLQCSQTACSGDGIGADTPVTIALYGETLGLSIPVRRPSAEEVQYLQAAVARVGEYLRLTEDEVEQIASDFDSLRRRGPLLDGSRG